MAMIGSSRMGFATSSPVLLEGHRACDRERHLRRVDLVVLAVGQRHADVDHRVARRMPVSSASSIPFLTAGMNSVGIQPPLILFTKSKPSPGGCSRLMTTTPNWPEPPVWRTNLPSTFSAVPLERSRGRPPAGGRCWPRPRTRASCGRPALRGAARPCRRSRSGRSPRRCAPWKVGSSSARRPSATDIFSWSARVFGSIDYVHDRLGERHRLELDRRCRERTACRPWRSA